MKNGSRLKVEGAIFGSINFGASNVTGQKVWRKLNALEVALNDARQLFNYAGLWLTPVRLQPTSDRHIKGP